MGKNNNRSKEFREELVLGVEYINFLTVWSQAKHGNCLRGELLRAHALLISRSGCFLEY